MTTFNILFTSSGRRFALIQHFKKVLSDLNLNGKIITADILNTAPTAYLSDTHEIVPPVSNSNYISTLLKLCKEHEIKLLIPLIDTELCLLAKHKNQFEELGTTVLVSSLKVNEICYNKTLTHQFFIDNNIKCPKVYDIDEILSSKNPSYPYLIKPAKGSSSVGVYKIRNKKELAFFKDYIKDPILQEYLSGDEYTIDALLDLKGNLLIAIPRLRMETRAGEVSKGKTINNKVIINEVSKVVSKLPGAIGCITLQCFFEDNQVKFIEINPRFGGGFPLTIAAGADYPKYLIETLMDIYPQTPIHNWKDNFVMLRYEDAIYLEKDALL